jgi:hypothetical protein
MKYDLRRCLSVLSWQGIEFWWLSLCQPDWVNTQKANKTLFLVVSVRIFLKEFSIWISRLSKEDPPSPMWIGINQLRASNKTAEETGIQGFLWSGPFFFLPSDIRAPGSQVFGLWNLQPAATGLPALHLSFTLPPASSGLHTQTWTTPLAFLVLYLAGYHLIASIITWANSCIYIYILLVLFLCRTVIQIVHTITHRLWGTGGGQRTQKRRKVLQEKIKSRSD